MLVAPRWFRQRPSKRLGAHRRVYDIGSLSGAGIAKKRPPPLALIVVGILLREISRDGGDADGEAQLFEFSLDLSGTPAVLIRESTNQGLNLWRDWRSSRPACRNGSPVEPKTLAVPTDDCVGLEDDQDLFPT